MVRRAHSSCAPNNIQWEERLREGKRVERLDTSYASGRGGLKPLLTTRSWMWESFSFHSTGQTDYHWKGGMSVKFHEHIYKRRCIIHGVEGCKLTWVPTVLTGLPVQVNMASYRGSCRASLRPAGHHRTKHTLQPKGGITRLNAWASPVEVLNTGDHKTR